MSVADNSRYKRAVLIRVENSAGVATTPPYFDVLHAQKTDYDDNQFLDVVEGDDWPSLALRCLNDPTGWWAIADASMVIDPFTELEAGKMLVAPSVERYLFDLLSDRV